MSNPWQRRQAIAANENAGVRVTPAAYPEWSFLVRRRCSWNADYQRALARIAARPDVAAAAARSREGKPEPGDDALDTAAAREAFAEGCIAGWQGVTDEKGKALPFGVANAAKVLAAFPDIFAELNAVSLDASKFAAPSADAKAEAIEGN